MRLHGGVLHGGVRHSNLRFPRRIVSCVTRGINSDMHSLRNVIVSVVTRSAVCGGRVSLRLARHVIHGMIGDRDGTIAISRVVGAMYGRFKLRATAVRAGSEGQRIIRTQRVTVCLTGGRASFSATGVNTLVKRGSRTAMLRTYGAVGRLGRISGSFHTRVSRVRTTLGGKWRWEVESWVRLDVR